MKYRRICLYGGPGLGKSVLATKLFSQLKIQNYDIELVSEWIKTWAHQKYEIKSYDQLYAFTKQLRKEDLCLNHGNIDLIVSDSPLLLNVAYSKKYGCEYWSALQEMANLFECKFPSVHILLDRKGIKYQNKGRWETKDEAAYMDLYIQQVLLSNNIEYEKFSTTDHDGILNYIKDKIDV